MAQLYVLRNGKGEFYCFAGGSNYCGPQLSRDPRNAKRMTAQGAGAVRRLLADPRYHGDAFERIPAEQAGAPTPPQENDR